MISVSDEFREVVASGVQPRGDTIQITRTGGDQLIYLCPEGTLFYLDSYLAQTQGLDHQFGLNTRNRAVLQALLMYCSDRIAELEKEARRASDSGW